MKQSRGINPNIALEIPRFCFFFLDVNYSLDSFTVKYNY